MVLIDNRGDVGNTPFFSIITVVKNASATLQRCIDSIKHQTFQNFEYIVIDGESVDGTVELLKLNNTFINYCITQSDEGLYFAMNKGIKLARGRFVGILNADDSYDLNTLERVHEAIVRNSGVDIIYGGMTYLEKPGVEYFIHHDELPNRMIFHPTCLVDRTTFIANGFFDTKYRVAADYDFMLKCKVSGSKFIGLNHTLANFSSGGTSQKMRFRSLIETSRIQAIYNRESLLKKSTKLIRKLIITYLRIILSKAVSLIQNSVRL